jgi:hypothetical protein
LTVFPVDRMRRRWQRDQLEARFRAWRHQQAYRRESRAEAGR